MVSVQEGQPGALLNTITLLHSLSTYDRELHLTPHVLQPGPSPYMSASMF
jgi:hypothetical protein